MAHYSSALKNSIQWYIIEIYSLFRGSNKWFKGVVYIPVGQFSHVISMYIILYLDCEINFALDSINDRRNIKLNYKNF